MGMRITNVAPPGRRAREKEKGKREKEKGKGGGGGPTAGPYNAVKTSETKFPNLFTPLPPVNFFFGLF